MFNENSGLVQVWFRLLQRGAKTIEEVPAISNLREVVEALLNKVVISDGSDND